MMVCEMSVGATTKLRRPKSILKVQEQCDVISITITLLALKVPTPACALDAAWFDAKPISLEL